MKTTIVAICLLLVLGSVQTKAAEVRAPCHLFSSGSAIQGTDGSEGLNWPNSAADHRSGSDGADCDLEKLFGSLEANRSDTTRINLTDLHQATQRDPQTAVARLLMKGFVGPKRDDVAPFPITLPIDWATKAFDRNWRFNLNAWKLLEPLFAHHGRTGEKLSLAIALKIVVDWAEYHVRDGRKNKFNWYDIAAGQRAMKLAYLIDLVFRNAIETGAETKSWLLILADQHARKLLDPDFINPGNHGTFQIHGLTALCRTLPNMAACKNAAPYIADQMERLVAGQFGAEAVHMEHSAEYHFFMFKVFERLFRTGWYDGLGSTKTLLTRVAANKKWLIFPTGEVVRHGDTDQRSEPLPLELAASAPRKCQRPVNQDADCAILKVFPKTGYATVRSAWNTDPAHASMLFLMGSYHSHAHKQRDHLSVELFELGQPILIDAGKFAYDETNPRRQYVKSTRAHNTVEIDGKEALKSRRAAVGSMIRAGRKTDWGVQLDAAMYRREANTEHERTLAYRPGRWLAVIDHLRSDRPRDFVQWFHLHESLRATMKDDGYIVDIPGRGRLGAKTLASVDGCKRARVRGQTKPRLQGWTSRAYRTFLENDAVSHSCRATAATLVTFFWIDRDATAPMSARLALTGVAKRALRIVDPRDGLDIEIKPMGKTESAYPKSGQAEVRTIPRPLPRPIPARHSVQATASRLLPPAIGIASRTASGQYKAVLENLVVTQPGRGWTRLDEVVLTFDIRGPAPQRFFILCGKHARCGPAPAPGSLVGGGTVSGYVTRYYDAGAFANGTATVRRSGEALTLSATARHVFSDGATIAEMPLDFTVMLVPDTQALHAKASNRNECGATGWDMGPILDAVAAPSRVATTFAQLARNGPDPDKVTVLMRHDVDRSPSYAQALAMAQRSRGLVGTYFVNLASGYAATMTRNGDYRANPDLVPWLHRLQDDGHEIGYHTDALFQDLFHDLPMDVWLGRELNALRRQGLVIVSEATNGSPHAKSTGAHNRYTYADFRKGGRLAHLVGPRQRKNQGFDGTVRYERHGKQRLRRLPSITMQSVGLRHAAYYPETFGVARKNFTYLTDSRLSPDDLLAALDTARPGTVVEILMHPWRWRDCSSSIGMSEEAGRPES